VIFSCDKKHSVTIELQHRKAASAIAKAHYKFFYTPIHKTQEGEEAILLDILFETNQYTNIIQHEVSSSFLINLRKISFGKYPFFRGFIRR
jgi:hypothetical protein